MKVLHVLYQSFPLITGSSTRSRDILLAQKACGILPVVVTSPFQNGVQKIDMLFGVKHYRTFNKHIDKPTSEMNKGFLYRVWRILRFPYFVFRIYKIVQLERPLIIHAHATFFCGLSAAIVGAIVRKPVVYEVRSLWEQRILEQNSNWISRLQVHFIAFLEGLSMKFANHVVVISNHLFDIVKTKGIPEERISIIGNAVNLEYLKELNIKKGLGRKIVRTGEDLTFGYVGSLSSIEGLEFLIEAFSRLREQGIKNELYIYGGGLISESLELSIKNKGLDNVHMRGVVASEEIALAYKEIDVIVNPRRNLPINNIVTPLKPLEAIAFECLFIGSNVGGIRELISDGDNGFLFEADSLDSLICTIRNVVSLKEAELIDFKKKAYQYLESTRNWRVNGEKYSQLYYSLV